MKSGMRLNHVVDWYLPSNVQTRRRMGIARESWKALQCRQFVTYPQTQHARDASSIGDAKRVPFIHDIIEDALDRCAADEAVVYTNADVGIVREGPNVIRTKIQATGCCYSRRVDFDRLDGPLTTLRQLQRGALYEGVDLFAFTPDWWRRWGDTIPDMLIGYEGWDHVFKRTMERSGFDPATMTPIIWHEKHPTHWEANLTSAPGNIHNRMCCIQWAIANGYRHELYARAPAIF